MANVSRDTFDKLKHYVVVRLQQGVPVVDADFNEEDNIRRYELQAFLKWFVGNGIPLGNDGFAIEEISGINDDFIIKGGRDENAGPYVPSDTDNAGRCFVEGWDAIIEFHTKYSEQKLFDSTVATAYGVPQLTTLNEETASDREDIVFLDVWEREVVAGEINGNDKIYDRNIINEDIGVETCTRIKREWVVRVREGSTTLPAVDDNADNMYRADHVYYELARIKWTKESDGPPAVISRQITDKRLTELKIGSYNDTQQILKDSFGSNYVLDHDAQPNLKVSLRDSINALLRGTLPGTPPLTLVSDNSINILGSSVEDSNGNIWVFWDSDRQGTGIRKIYYNRFLQADGIWEGETIHPASNGDDDKDPVAVLASDGDIWLFWHRNNNDIWYARRNHTTGDWSSAELVAGAGPDPQLCTVADHNDIWVFRCSGIGQIDYHFFANDIWQTGVVLQDGTERREPTAIIDTFGDAWLFWISNDDIYHAQKLADSAPSEWGAEERMTFSIGSTTGSPTALVEPGGNIWVFWSTDRFGHLDIWYNRRTRRTQVATSWEWEGEVRLTQAPREDDVPSIVAHPSGDIFVFWFSPTPGENHIWYNRFSEGNGWAGDKQMTTASSDEDSPMAIIDSIGDIWVFWNLAGNDPDRYIWYRKLISEI